MELLPLRPLYYALTRNIGDHRTVLSISKADLADTSKALAMLKQWTPKLWHFREMQWPQEDTPGWPRFADVGVFEPGPKGLPIFRTLTDLRNELESYVFQVADMKEKNPPFERVGPMVFR